ncbi:hypothetical protein LY625_09200 [Lysobacter sp. GX 14042]|uniref:hypothetical protein n=1 Tax=Lysobacter sp. GX 14042 TaxID=2907155 RepID=UPI001F2E9F1B|nr:hypothetical protein [Lysobacter sp. GX 14042]MCE7032784.1 hypothetical protein [Lysobacter sp. GX 14042]
MLLRGGVSNKRDRRTLNVLNIPELSSFRTPNRLRQSYPGLRVVRKIPVDQYTTSAVLKLHEISKEGWNLLILDAAGDERDVLEALKEENSLEHFDAIILYAGESPLYDGAADGRELCVLLGGCGFYLGSVERDRWDRLCLTFICVRSAPAGQATMTRVAELAAKVDALSREVERARREAAAQVDARRSAEATAERQGERISRQAAEIDRLSLQVADAEDHDSHARALRESFKAELNSIEAQLKLLRALTRPSGLSDDSPL